MRRGDIPALTAFVTVCRASQLSWRRHPLGRYAPLLFDANLAACAMKIAGVSKMIFGLDKIGRTSAQPQPSCPPDASYRNWRSGLACGSSH